MTATLRATKDTVLPLSEPIFDQNGTRLDEIAMPKGSQVLLGFLGCNTNKKLWGEDAYEWKPERWMSPLPTAVTDAHIPGVYSNLCVAPPRGLVLPSHSVSYVGLHSWAENAPACKHHHLRGPPCGLLTIYAEASSFLRWK